MTDLQVFLIILCIITNATTTVAIFMFMRELKRFKSEFMTPSKPEEEDDIPTPVKPMYDVDSFKDRMERMKAQIIDGVVIYEAPEKKKRDDFTGVEIIRPSTEVEMENMMSR